MYVTKGLGVVCVGYLMSLYLAPLYLKRALGIFVDQISSLLENSDGPCIFELFDRETNLGKTDTVNTTRVLMMV